MLIEDTLGSILVERQFLNLEECRGFLASAESEGCFLEEVLIREQKFSRKALLKILENEYFCPAVDVREVSPDAALLSKVPRKLAARHLVLPIRMEGQSTLLVAFGNPDNAKVRETIALTVWLEVAPLVALRNDLREAIKRGYDEMEKGISASEVPRDGEGEAASADTERKPETSPEINFASGVEGENSTMALVDRIIEEAAKRNVTDIHIEPKENGLVLRYRIDGMLSKVATLPREAAAALLSRIKILGKMDIAEHRLPQDGRYTMKQGESLFDLRISSVPSQFGEKIVIRLLSKTVGLLQLENLNMPPAVAKAYAEVLQSPQGFYLVTGPTGSGKTTTLYATLCSLDCASVNVATLEDPIEYSLPDITQVQVQENIGLTFASGLRSFLRQDPDVILIGELRDAETVSIACRAALTGHKVFSTIHSSDAAQAIPRLIDMGVPPYLVAATVKGILSQRLVRVLCEECKEAYRPNQTELAILDYPKIGELQRGRGCKNCSGTGYKGRMALFEYLPVAENIQKLIFEHASSFSIRYAARQNGMIPLADYAKQAVLNGTTSVEEIQRSILSETGREQLCTHCGQVVSLDFATCPFCQHTLKEKCPGCGQPLDPAWSACPGCGKEIESETRKTYCPHCQAPLYGRLEACPFCGGGLS